MKAHHWTIALLVALTWFNQCATARRIPRKLATADDSSDSPSEDPGPMMSCPGLYPTLISFNLSQDFFLHKVNVSMALSDIVRSQEYGNIKDLEEEQRKIYERFDGFNDVNDQAVVAKTMDSEICFVAFQSTVDLTSNPIGWVIDQVQNAWPFSQRIGRSDCEARCGYVDVYNTTYQKELLKTIDSCVDSCDHGCPLVMTGYSQGASGAIVGAIDLVHYTPETITFAPPKTILNLKRSPCTTADKIKHYRFVNTDAQMGYDAVPNQFNVWGERALGKLFLLDDLNFPLLIPNKNIQKDRYPRNTFLHEWEIYRERIKRVAAGNCFPIPAAQWPRNHYCNFDDECQSNYCLKGNCMQGL